MPTLPRAGEWAQPQRGTVKIKSFTEILPHREACRGANSLPTSFLLRSFRALAGFEFQAIPGPMPRLAADRRRYFSGMACAGIGQLPCWSSLHGRNCSCFVYTEFKRCPAFAAGRFVRRYVRERSGKFSVNRRCVLIRTKARQQCHRLSGFWCREFATCGFLLIQIDAPGSR